MAPHSSTLAWKLPWMEEPGRLQSMGSLRVGHDWATSLSLFTFHALEKEMATHSSVLAWRIPGPGEPGRLPSLGSYRVGHDWSDLAVVCIYTVKYNSSIKKKDWNFLPFTATWIDLEDVMLSEINQTEKDKYCMISLICGIQKNATN